MTMSSYIKNYQGFINEVYGANPYRNLGEYDDEIKMRQEHEDLFPPCIKDNENMVPRLLDGKPVYHGPATVSFDEDGEQHNIEPIYFPDYTRTAKTFGEPNPIDPAAENKLYKWSCADFETTVSTPVAQATTPVAQSSESVVRRFKRK